MNELKQGQEPDWVLTLERGYLKLPQSISEVHHILRLCNEVQQLRQRLQQAESELAKEKRIVEITQRAVENRPLCPDCRDKTKEGDECLRCHIQRLERQLKQAEDAAAKAEFGFKNCHAAMEKLVGELDTSQQRVAELEKDRKRLDAAEKYAGNIDIYLKPIPRILTSQPWICCGESLRSALDKLKRDFDAAITSTAQEGGAK